MDNIRDILTSLKDRFTNPLLFSFLISWILFNWKIVFAITYYDIEQIERLGYCTIYDFIEGELNKDNTILYPALYAFAYTIIAPVIKNLVRLFYSWCYKWGGILNLRVTAGAKIPYERYIKLREEYDKRTKMLEDTISKEGANFIEVSDLQTKLLESQTKENELTNKLNRYTKFEMELYNTRFLDGYWTYNYKDANNNNLKGSDNIFIDNGKYFKLEDHSNRIHAFNITEFNLNLNAKSIFFIKERIGIGPPAVRKGQEIQTRYIPCKLTIENEELLVGIENGNSIVEYKRIKRDLPMENTE